MYTNSSLREHSKANVVYYYDNDIAGFEYGNTHDMKPYRIQLAHNAILATGLFDKLEIRRPHRASFKTMTSFHDEDYIRFLDDVNPSNISSYRGHDRYDVTVGGDCPVFDGLYDFCSISCGGSLNSAVVLNTGQADIAINWMGGLHHAKKSKASGFCYTNDIVIAILELLKLHDRVLYVDIDVHHGDGVEEAFLTTDRVMTVSFHHYTGTYFPGTGNSNKVGIGEGKLYSVNVPLKQGITDDQYGSIYKTVMAKVMERYDPSVIVLQCGADSLNGDYLGVFNLSVKGHGECVDFLRSYNKPLMLLGGGGYTPTIVARCWTNETAIAVGVDLPAELPYDILDDHLHADNIDNSFNYEIKKFYRNYNNDKKLGELQTKVLNNLNKLPHVPSVQMQPMPDNNYEELAEMRNAMREEADPDVTLPTILTDQITHHDSDFYDSERAGDDRRNESNAKRANRRSKRLTK
uniref:Histone deacetylase n=1 Tax=Caenorhabditis tropicalis TaxID=1561998 RepID=A0A1I7T8K9_9PELO